jgi:regulator of replication initiation timing
MLSDYTDDNIMRQGKKIPTAAVGMLCLITLTSGACVTRGTYDSATADLGATKAELYSIRTEAQGLTQQFNVLQERQSDLAKQREVVVSALQQAKKKMNAERAASHTRVTTLNRSIQQLTAQQKSLRYGLKRATKEQVTLQLTVDDYTSQLRSREELQASTIPQSAAVPNEPAKAAPVPPAQTQVAQAPTPQPNVVTASSPVNQSVVTPKPPARAQPPEPVEEDWLTYFKNWFSSLWESVLF